MGRWLGLAIVALALVAPRHASADATAQDLATARALFNDGVKLRAQGDLAGAIERLQAAYALFPTPIIGLELGQTLLEAGKLVEARETCYGASRLPVPAAESSAGASARLDAARLAEKLRPRIPALRIEVTGVAPGESVRVTVDAEVIPPQVLPFPFKVNPGVHHLTASAGPSEAPAADVTLAEGEERAVTLALPSQTSETSEHAVPEAQEKPGASPLQTKVPPPRPEGQTADAGGDGRGLQRAAGIGVGALGILALGVGVTFAVIARSRYDDGTQHCPTDTSCDILGLSLTREARNFATASTVTVVSGAALVAAGAVVLFSAAHHRSVALLARPVFGAGSGGASLVYDW